jgi:hypothetical protein
MSTKRTITEILGVSDKKQAEALITSSLFQDYAPKQGDIALIVSMCESYGLNPLLGMLYIKRDNAGCIYPALTVDGWYKLVNDQEDCNGYEFIESESVFELPKQFHDSESSYCFESIGCKIYRKGREHTPVVYEYIQECFNPNNQAWFTHSKRLLRHKSFSQAARIVYNFSGLYEPDEAERIIAEKNVELNGLTGEKKDVSEIPDFDVITPGKSEVNISDMENKNLTSEPELKEVPAKATKSEEEKVEVIVQPKEQPKLVEPDVESAKLVKQYLQNALKTNKVNECAEHLKGRMVTEYHDFIDGCALSIKQGGSL